MWMPGRIHFQVCYIPYKHSCPLRGFLYPYRHLWPVCRCLSPLPALFTSIWICLSVRNRCCAHCRTEASDAKSSFTTTNWPATSVSFVSRRMSAAASSVFFRSLHAMMTRAPVVQKYHVGYLQQATYRHTRTCTKFGFPKVWWSWNWVCGNYVKHLYTAHCIYRGRDSSVGIAIRYGLDGPGTESRCGARFSAPVQTGPVVHPSSYTMGNGSFPGIKRPECGVDHPPPYRVEIKGRVNL